MLPNPPSHADGAALKSPHTIQREPRAWTRVVKRPNALILSCESNRGRCAAPIQTQLAEDPSFARITERGSEDSVPSYTRGGQRRCHCCTARTGIRAIKAFPKPPAGESVPYSNVGAKNHE